MKLKTFCASLFNVVMKVSSRFELNIPSCMSI